MSLHPKSSRSPKRCGTCSGLTEANASKAELDTALALQKVSPGAIAKLKLPSAASIGSKGYLVARIRLDDDQLARELPLGAAGTTAIYTDVGKPFHVITKITVRIKAWMHYLPI